ncbi:MAG TPA: peptidylprolyl isomerase [Chryseosolibacter sp.]|nr:peptidylprolyl isomerase [Chryseosolibacter sp.]
MALIGTLRNKMGTWVVVFVFVAILAFILNDLLGNNSVLFNDNEVGEIAGHTVSYDEFQSAVQEREASYILNTGREPSDREMATVRQQAWETLILRHAIEKQFDKVGVEVTNVEQQDMIWGNNVDQNIRQAFTDPNTGEFNKERLLSYLKELNNPPADPQMQGMWQEQRTRWEIFQRDLKPGRRRIKYENLLLKTNYITTVQAEREYHVQNDVAEVKFAYVPYYTVSDSAAEPSDADMKAYYNKNIEKYKTEATRDLKFVTFSLEASHEDSIAVREEITRLAAEFAAAEDDSTFATINSDVSEAYGTYNIGSLPTFLQDETLTPGKVIGPFIDGGAYKVAKVSDVKKDTSFTARASHILIRWEKDTEEAKKAAKEKARDILKEIKDGADFGAMARQHGTDGTASKGGDLGWFSSGRMVKPFEDAVFGATKTGVLNDVIETDFGYHIINVTNVKDNVAYEVAIIERAITPSDNTTNEAFRKAELFAGEVDGIDDFTKTAADMGYTAYDAKNITSDERRINMLGDARQVVQWLFRDAEKGKVSEVFDLQDQYVVAVMTGEIEEGHKPFEIVKDQVKPEVVKEQKANTIIEKLKGKTGSLEEVASAYGQDANVYSAPSLKLSSNSLPTAGFDPRAVGIAFSLESGKRSAPFSGENGVFVMELQSLTIAPETNDYASYKTILEQQNSMGRSGFSINEAIKEAAKIEDQRYKFY